MVNVYAVADLNGNIVQSLQTSMRYIRADVSFDDTTHYVNDEDVIVPRQRYEIAMSVDGLRVIVSGIPSGVRVETNGVDVLTDGSDLVIDYDLPGTYSIALTGRVDYVDDVREVTLGDDA